MKKEDLIELKTHQSAVVCEVIMSKELVGDFIIWFSYCFQTGKRRGMLERVNEYWEARDGWHVLVTVPAEMAKRFHILLEQFCEDKVVPLLKCHYNL